MTKPRINKGPGSSPAGQRGKAPPDVPYVMRLHDDQSLLVLIPGKWCERDVSGELLFKPEAVRLLDRVRVTAASVPSEPTPGYIRTLRGALGLTQAAFGQHVGVDSMTVSRWERGTVRPGPAAVRAIEKLRKAAGRRSVTIAA